MRCDACKNPFACALRQRCEFQVARTRGDYNPPLVFVADLQSHLWHQELDRYEAAMCYNPYAAPPPEGVYDDD